ncbi:MAG TPA: orotidine 5'-phosphate decarboxylase / HUMPS family protein [Pelolinea sp.]|nr:orotidine 5'-phosphate decarboxylase / HUMPS family protein [Pelolinea sp.]
MLDEKTRYLQIAFNYDTRMVGQLLPRIPHSSRILVEAGTPYIKREGMAGIRYIRRLWPGVVVADMKVADGALGEVQLAHAAGANAITVLGNAPRETLNLFINECQRLNMVSMIDMISVKDPLDVIRLLREPPDVIVLHLGRDEETTRGKLIQYRHVNRIRSKFPSLISAAGGVDVRAARSAIFNGANIVVANIVQESDAWKGISADEDIGVMAKKFLETIE